MGSGLGSDCVMTMAHSKHTLYGSRQLAAVSHRRAVKSHIHPHAHKHTLTLNRSLLKLIIFELGR